MIGLIRTLTPEDGTAYEEILSFETENFYGIYNDYGNEFLIIAKEDISCNVRAVDCCCCRSLDDLDRETFEICEEHIIGVSKSNKYKFQIVEE